MGQFPATAKRVGGLRVIGGLRASLTFPWRYSAETSNWRTHYPGKRALI